MIRRIFPGSKNTATLAMNNPLESVDIFPDIQPTRQRPYNWSSEDTRDFFAGRANDSIQPVTYMDEFATKEDRKSDRRIVIAGILASVGILSAIYGITHSDNDQETRRAKIEECVEDRVGYNVTIQINPEDNNIIKPPKIANDIDACLPQ